MALNRNTGLALGFGIGIVIASVFFGTSWMMKNGGNLLKTQALQSTPTPSAPSTVAEPIEYTTTVPVASTDNPSDTIVNRMAPSQDEVIQDIGKNIQELYGSDKAN
jgi:hypothetical protein